MQPSASDLRYGHGSVAPSMQPDDRLMHRCASMHIHHMQAPRPCATCMKSLKTPAAVTSAPAPGPLHMCPSLCHCRLSISMSELTGHRRCATHPLMCSWDHVHDGCCLRLPYDERLRAVASAGESNDVVGAAELRKGMILCIGLQCQTWWC